MVLKLISAALILFTTFMGIKHGWSALSGAPESAVLFQGFEINKRIIQLLGILSIAGGWLILFPATFTWGNYLNAFLILILMVFFLKVGDFKHFLIEIPFLLIPFVILYLKHPLR